MKPGKRKRLPLPRRYSLFRYYCCLGSCISCASHHLYRRFHGFISFLNLGLRLVGAALGGSSSELMISKERMKTAAESEKTILGNMRENVVLTIANAQSLFGIPVEADPLSDLDEIFCLGYLPAFVTPLN